MKNNILNNFGKKLHQLRLAKGWSQEELAAKTDLHRTYIGSVERSERNISLINIHKIAKAFNISVSKLLDF